MKKLSLWYCPIHSVSQKELLDKVNDIIKSDKKSFFITPNPEIMLMAKENPEMNKALNSTSLNPTDGSGLSWAYYFLKILPKLARNKTLRFFHTWYQVITSAFRMFFLPQTITKHFPFTGGSDWFKIICKNAEKENLTIFLLGGTKESCQTSKQILEQKYSSLKIVGTNSDRLPQNDEKVIKQINELKPNILFVALGSPKQELWIYKNLNKLDIKLAIGIGASFDFLSGNQIDAPNWMKKRGIKWIWRILVSPFEKKIGNAGFLSRFKRIYNATYVFTKEVAITKFNI